MRDKPDGRVFKQHRSNDAAPIDDSSEREVGPSTSRRKHASRTVGVTEQRLRSANQQSWLGSKKGWTTLFKRFMPGSSR
ncbi:MAG: hypothetical protein ACR2GG_07405 [Gemmatimonadaceae bacterium]